MPDSVKVVARNKKAFHTYYINERYEAGMVLLGSEIKSIRAGHVQIGEAYVAARGGELWLFNAHIADYLPAARQGHAPLRTRKLLLHKREISKILNLTREKGYTIVPLQMYLKDGRAKVEIAVARGKKLYDKRQIIAKREAERRIAREIGRRR